MASLTQARKKAMVDAELATLCTGSGTGHTHIGYSVDGSSEYSLAIMERTPVADLGGWTTPSAAATYAPGNLNAGDSHVAGEISGSVTITHYATFTAATAGTQLTDWIATDNPDAVLITGGKLSHAAGAIKPISAT
jgi:hypothetical protein